MNLCNKPFFSGDMLVKVKLKVNHLPCLALIEEHVPLNRFWSSLLEPNSELVATNDQSVLTK